MKLSGWDVCCGLGGERWEMGSKSVGKRKKFARFFADVGKMWGKLRNRKSLKSLISRL
jgi:hypothetical protein